ncbi:MAG: rpoN [Hydrocarboniphaga sp.]|uniref:RNA polymerase factor sigma-54 n=1 Tax=Hydrocarboniphaga sp. TaxID=2033016 RepID=UPI00261A7FFB|nr:RNA polymerase factor sigma-54 [Hydrocarboniphaga sp.]MDB5969874.1 rpoN [Hydrocarboniphaga sp.]
MKNLRPQMKMQAGQSQVMTQQLLQSIRLLQLTSQELEMEVRQALDSNLMLEAEETDEADTGPGESSVTVAAEVEPAALEVSGADAGAHEHVEADFDWSSSESWTGGEPVDEDGESAASRVPDALPTDPRLIVLSQLQLIVSDLRTAELVAAIIDAVDDSGYLVESLESLLEQLLDKQPPADAAYTLAELEAALQLVQSVEPTGFAARSLSECLSLQLQVLPRPTPGRALALRIVSEHLAELALMTEHMLAAAVDHRVEQVHQALALIKALDPKPGAAGAMPAQAVVPEVIVTGQRGAWRVELNPGTLPRVRINRGYEKAIGGAGQHRALRDQLVEARWLVRGLEMRQETLLKTARVVFERQAGFLKSGEEAMAPLNLMDVAEAIGVHESTVSRVVANKYALTPWGVYPLKAFFPVQIAGRDSDTSGTAVRAMIRKIIDAENRVNPLSDGDVAALLARRGVNVARRTVAKYREGMRIAAAPARMQRILAAAG